MAIARQISMTQRRHKSHWYSLLVFSAAVCVAGVAINTHWGSQNSQADLRAFRKTSHSAGSHASVQAALIPPALSSSASVSPAAATTTVTTTNGEEDPYRAALQSALSLLEKGRDRLQSTRQYTATFVRQERVGDELTEGDVTEIKVRHEPFSVYMKWTETDAGQELLYVDGVNDGKLLLKQVGWKSRLLPIISLDPDCVLAMSQSRYPVTQMGLLRLVDTLINDRRRDLDTKAELKCQLFDDEFCDDRACYRFVLEYGSPEVSATYRKSDLFIDKEFSVPIQITNFTWPQSDWGKDWGCEEMDDETLIEYYSYCDLALGAKLNDLDFDRSNKEYGFEK